MRWIISIPGIIVVSLSLLYTTPEQLLDEVKEQIASGIILTSLGSTKGNTSSTRLRRLCQQRRYG